MPKQRDLWDRIWKDRHGEVVIFEWPNRWLGAWAVLMALSLTASSNAMQVAFWWLSLIALAIWAYFEITQGVNYFRRGLGVVGLLMVLAASFSLGMI